MNYNNIVYNCARNEYLVCQIIVHTGFVWYILGEKVIRV